MKFKVPVAIAEKQSLEKLKQMTVVNKHTMNKNQDTLPLTATRNEE